MWAADAQPGPGAERAQCAGLTTNGVEALLQPSPSPRLFLRGLAGAMVQPSLTSLKSSNSGAKRTEAAGQGASSPARRLSPYGKANCEAGPRPKPSRASRFAATQPRSTRRQAPGSAILERSCSR